MDALSISLAVAASLVTLQAPEPAPVVFGLTLGQWQALQAIATIGGILAAALWFFGRRVFLPRAVVSQRISHRWLTDNTLWLRSAISVKNKGDIAIRILRAHLRVLQVLPLAGSVGDRIRAGGAAHTPGRPDVAWGQLERREVENAEFHVEPGEVALWYWDFVITRPYRPDLVIVYAYMENSTLERLTGRRTGWNLETVYSLVDDEDHEPEEAGVQRPREATRGAPDGEAGG